MSEKAADVMHRREAARLVAENHSAKSRSRSMSALRLSYDDARYRRGLVADVNEAAAKGLPHVRMPAPARLTANHQDRSSPFASRVHWLTDHACASACQDLADLGLSRRMGLQENCVS